MTMTGIDFLQSLTGEWVRITPETGRVFVGHLTKVEGDIQNPTLTVDVNGHPFLITWAAINRLKLCDENTR